MGLDLVLDVGPHVGLDMKHGVSKPAHGGTERTHEC